MALSNLATPTRFFTARVELRGDAPEMTTLCAGYERGEWRKGDFVDHLFDYLVEFALKWSQLQNLNSATAYRMIEDAARRVYESEKYGKRGEFGELLLHAALRSHFGSEPAVSKLFYKTGDNDTVKGFDCVHVVDRDETDGLELWLGEAKFYADIGDAMQKAIASLEELTETDRLKREFVLIRGLVDDTWPYAEEFKMLTEGKSLDEVFDVLRIPVLLTYDSAAVSDYDRVCEEYEAALREEVEGIFNRFKGNARLPAEIYIHLILVPLKDKAELNAALHKRLKDLQGR
jgi:Cap4 SAVED domain